MVAIFNKQVMDKLDEYALTLGNNIAVDLKIAPWSYLAYVAMKTTDNDSS